MKYFWNLLIVLVLFSRPLFAEPLRIQTTKQNIVFDVEIADTNDKRAKGLMNRDSLKPNAGMLFIFDKVSAPQFWMKDTKISLDVVYIGEDGLVKGIHENAVPYDKTPFPSPAPVLAVLEIAGGTAKKLQISAGNKVMYKIFEKDLK